MLKYSTITRNRQQTGKTESCVHPWNENTRISLSFIRNKSVGVPPSECKRRQERSAPREEFTLGASKSERSGRVCTRRDTTNKGTFKFLPAIMAGFLAVGLWHRRMSRAASRKIAPLPAITWRYYRWTGDRAAIRKFPSRWISLFRHSRVNTDR